MTETPRNLKKVTNTPGDQQSKTEAANIIAASMHANIVRQKRALNRVPSYTSKHENCSHKGSENRDAGVDKTNTKKEKKATSKVFTSTPKSGDHATSDIEEQIHAAFMATQIRETKKREVAMKKEAASRIAAGFKGHIARQKTRKKVLTNTALHSRVVGSFQCNIHWIAGIWKLSTLI